MGKKSKAVYRNQTSPKTHTCCWCKKRRGGCEIEPNPPHKSSRYKSWICFHCREERKTMEKKERKEVFTGTIERECDYCGLHRKCKVTRDGKKICESCEEKNINAIHHIKELEIFG